MTVIELLTHLRQLNIELWVEDDRLRFRAPSGVLTPELRAVLAEHKAEVAAFLKMARDTGRKSGPIPLSFAQQRLWFLDQLHPNSTLYTVPMVVRLTGTLHGAALQQSLDEIARRHEIVRTTFTVVDGQPAQVIAPAGSEAAQLPLAQIDLSDVPTAAQSAAVQDRVHRELQQPFDLARGPLVRATLLRLNPTEHVIILMIHHIIFDAWSQQVFMAELTTLYAHFSQPGATNRAAPLPELPLQYADYARWQHRWLQEAGLEQQMGYWRQQLHDLPVLQLIPDRPRPASGGFEGREYHFAVSDACATALRRLSQAAGCTIFMTLLAAWQVLLARYTAQSDIVIGTPIANRTQAESQKLIGFFVNTLVLRTDLRGNPTFREALHRVREVCLAAYAHQDVPFDTLVEALQPVRDLSRHPLFQVMFAYQPAPGALPALPDLKLELQPIEIEQVKFDLNLTMVETMTGLEGILKYRTDLFEERTITRMAEHLHVLLAAISSTPDAPIYSLPLLSAAEYQAMLDHWRAPDTYAITHCLHHAFERQASRAPHAVAVTDNGVTLSYAALNDRSNQLARHLQTLRVGPEVCVGLFVERSPDLIVGLLGILKAGGAYVPLDPALPPERLAFILHDARVAVLVTQAAFSTRLPDLPVPVVRLDHDAEIIAAYSTTTPDCLVLPDHPAYVIYTSGSTGTPKGVMVTHANVLRLFAATQPWFAFDARDVWTLFHSAAFDFSVWEIWGALLYGGTLVIVPYLLSRSPAALYALLIEEGVTVLNQTPSAFRQLIQVDADAIDSELSLRFVIFGGEALELHSVQPWFARHGDLRPKLVNMYGITETTVHVTYRPLTTADLQRTASVIGGAIPDLEVYLLDHYLQPVPVGVPGEIYVGGAGLARGYLHRPALTAERFVPHPLSTTAGQRLYKSGDLARYQANGELEYLGRIDQQVKIRGFRIELGEIEAVLAQHPGVRDVVVIAREDRGPMHRQLVAYVVPTLESQPTIDDLRRFLGTRLPDYMIPTAFVALDKLPLTVNGKLDRNALPSPDQARPALEEDYTAPRSPLEHVLVRLWQDLLGVATIGVHDNFFALGGNSIQAALLINQIQAALQEIVYVVAIFDAPTVAELAVYLSSRYPQSVTRLSGSDRREEPAVDSDTPPRARPIGQAEVARLRQLITPLPPRPAGSVAKNPPAVFILSPPRSGSTLLRVMLAGHPRLFAPPELELLSFNTLAERKAAFTDRDRFWLEGTIRAIMALNVCDAPAAEQLMAQYEAQDLSVQAFYRLLQTWLGDRMLVDKTPSYALDRAILQRAEEDFTHARYIHLIRHPYGMIHSFEEAKLDQIFFRRPHAFTTRELAELIWLISHQNILDFFQQIPAERRHTVHFEEMVSQPVRSMEQICTFLGLDFDPAMLQPYADTQQRMTDGPHAASRMLGDVKFHEHQQIDASTSERWRDSYAEEFLGDLTWQVAEHLGYAAPRSSSGGATLTPILPQPRTGSDRFPCSFAQQRLWFIDQLQPGSTAYNIFVTFRLIGSLDLMALQRSFDTIMQRHESLRTVFAVVEGTPMQVIVPPQPTSITRIDLRNLPMREREAAAIQRATQEARSPFDLACGPLLRLLLLQMAEDDHILAMNMHHIVSDGWSERILIQEVTTLYAAYLSDERAAHVLPPLPIQYADYAVWQRQWLQGSELAAQIAYWERQLAGLPVLDLPIDYPRPAIQTTNGRHHAIGLPAALSQELAALSRREGVTLFMTLLAAFHTLLMRYTGQVDIVVGTPIAGRNRAELEGLIGFFVNSLVIRTNLSGNPTFRAALQHVRTVTSEAYAHQDVPFEQLVESIARDRDLNRHPLFQIMFMLQSAPLPSTPFPGLEWSFLEIEGGSAKFDLSLSLVETPQGLQGGWGYNTDVFATETIARMAGHWEILLEAIVADPDRRIAELPLLTGVEHRQILFDWNRSAADYPRDAAVHQLFEAQAARTPNASAIVFEGARLTYAELNTQANQLAHYLRAQGVGPDVLVALCVERSLEMIVGMLAILKAGGAYVPLDPAYPQERIQYMLAHSRAPVLLTQAALVERLPEHTAQVFRLDADWARLAQEPVTNPPRTVLPEHLAYIIFTSGSTGRPKGVMVTQRGLVNLVYGLRAYFGDPAVQTTGLITSISFDISVNQIFPTLVFGRTLHIIPDPVKFDSRALLRYLDDHQIHLLDAVPSYMQAVLNEVAPQQPPNALRYLLIGGEKIEQRLLQSVFGQLGPQVQVVNIYGLTEISDINLLGVIRAADVDQPITVGRPLHNNRIYILDQHQQPQPVGIAGEVCITGESVSRGYVFRPELTAERFVPCPFEDGQIMVRTGDLGRWRADGTVEILGRIDHQVKIRGYRIETGEIEAALLRHPGVQAAVVMVRADGTQDTQLVAYVVAQPTQAVTRHDLLEALGQSLPAYMLPAMIVMLEALPLTPNGKVDRKALSLFDARQQAGTTPFIGPRTIEEWRMVRLWEDLLNTGPISVIDNFFELGGHSLLSMRLLATIQQEFGCRLSLMTLFQAPTVERLVAALRHDPSAQRQSSLVPLQPAGQRRPFFCVHPVGGTVLPYGELARRLGADRPIYGIQARGLEVGQPIHDDIRAMARSYVEEIRLLQPEGPYLLGGWSLGGVIAFEMARLLHQQGQQVALLALIDSAILDANAGAPDAAALVAQFAHDLGQLYGQELSIVPDDIRDLTPEQQLEYVFVQARRQAVVPPAADLDALRRLAAVFQSNLLALVRYTPVPLPLSIALLQAADRLRAVPTRNLADAWRALAVDVDTQVVPGDHHTIMRPPYVQAVADWLHELFEAVQMKEDASCLASHESRP